MAKKRDEGSVLKLNGKWYARLRYTDAAGKRREKKRTCISHAKAKSAIAELRDEIERENGSRKTYAFADQWFRDEYVHAAKFVGGKKQSGFRQDTKSVERYLDRARDFFGKRYLDEITFADLRRYKLHIEQLPARSGGSKTVWQRSVSDVNHHLKRVRRLFNVAVEQGWITVNPFARGSHLVTDSFETERTRILTAAEETRLIANCGEWRSHLIPLIIFAVETAMRRGEIQKLRWSDIDLDARRIKVDFANTKTLRSRLVPVTDRLLATLSDLNAARTSRFARSFVFGNADFKRSFKTACRLAKLTDVHFHDLRHTAITRMLEKGISPPLVMKISGHTQMKTFMRYVNQTESSIYDIAMKLSAAA